ncbi:hypothetical protein C3L33_16617, partial [Rhododendron williamsianum]
MITVGGNQLWGPIPASLSNASRMVNLGLSENNLSGGVPFDLGRKMKDLWKLNLGENNLGLGDASDLRFIDSLTNCSKLEQFGFNENGFGGVLPTSIANLSSHLNLLVAGRNRLLALPERVMEIVDLHMLLEEPVEAENDAQKERVRRDKIRECLVSLLRIGIACSAESPSERMNIKDVIIGLMTIKEVFLGVGIHGRRQMRMRLTGEGTS